MEGEAPGAVEVVFQPVSRRVRVERGATLMAAAQAAGAGLAAICGGGGSCETCRVRLMRGEVAEVTSIERQALSAGELAMGVRLACQTRALSDVVVSVPPESLVGVQRLQVEGEAVGVDLDPAVVARDVSLTPPTVHDSRDDFRRLREALPGVSHVDLRVLRSFSQDARAGGWHGTAFVRGDEVVGFGRSGAHGLGLACDLGTTKLAGYLLDLGNGRVVAARGAMNPQVAYGEDVMSRLAYAMKGPAQAEALREALVAAIQDLAGDLLGSAGVERGEVVDVVAVANVAIHHLFLGLPVAQLGLAPYVPAIADPLDVKALEVGLDFAPGAYIHVLPNVGGFVGADHVAVLAATDLRNRPGVSVVMDVGTNTEITVGVEGELISTSAASGPALEGAHIRDGMRAADGAIDRVFMDREGLHFQTIGGAAASGLCGSGILDLVAGLRQGGIIGPTGRIDSTAPSVRMGEDGPGVVVAAGANTAHGRDIVFRRDDVTQVMLAKGAIRAALSMLLAKAGVREADIGLFLVAGAFGSYINLASAMAIGMLPTLPRDRFRQIGNAAGAGARLCLVNKLKREEAREIASSVRHLELTAEPSFASTFADSLLLEAK